MDIYIKYMTQTFRNHKQLIILILWVCFLGLMVWQHAQRSMQPPIYDAYTYFLKAYNFWTEANDIKPFNPFNVPPTIRPPGTVLMSYPFGFDADFHKFYFRSVFFSILFLCIAIVISGYHRELESQGKWNLVLIAVFLSITPCFYLFEVSPNFAVIAYWGMVDCFLAGVAALAASAIVRSIFDRSLVWLGLAAVLSSICLTIKPSGILVMMLTGLIWFGLGIIELLSAWNVTDKRRDIIRWLVLGMIVLSIPYIAIFIASFSSEYFSIKNMIFGNAAIVVMKNELAFSWSMLMDVIHLGGIGYASIIWFIVMMILVLHSFWHSYKNGSLFYNLKLVGSILGSIITLLFGIWFWLFGSGGTNQIRYFIPFYFMAIVFSIPAFIMVMRTIDCWRLVILTTLLLAPSVNMAILLPQHNPSLAWQLWTGVNLTSGSTDTDPVYDQAKSFASVVKHENRNVLLYSFTRLPVDSYVQSTIDYWRVTMPPMPEVKIFRPVDWQRPSTLRLDEMLAADYWLFSPKREQVYAQSNSKNSPIDKPPLRLNQDVPIHEPCTGESFYCLTIEVGLFEDWASHLTSEEGVAVISETPMLRLLRITDANKLELAMDAFISKHQWSSTFLAANPKRQYSKQEMEAELATLPLIVENVFFGDSYQLRAISTKQNGEELTLRIWWKPLSPKVERDGAMLIHLLNDKNDILINYSIPISKRSSLDSLDNTFFYSELTFKKPSSGEITRLGIRFSKPNQIIHAEMGTRDMDGQRVIVPIHLTR